MAIRLQTPEPRIDFKAAVSAAQDFLKSIEAYAEQGMYNLRLEEFKHPDFTSFWWVTLGFDTSPISRRQYRTFRINSQTGEVMSMNIGIIDEDW